MRLEENENLCDFKDLTVKELMNGYFKRNETNDYCCIFCGEVFEEGIIYTCGERLLTAEKAVEEHINEVHGGAFQVLINLDKQICGLTDIQKSILTNLYDQNDNKTIGENMGISAATVRTHKFNLQKAKREAKILLALIETVEDENFLNKVKPKEPSEAINSKNNTLFEINSLHPFFTQFKYK